MARTERKRAQDFFANFRLEGDPLLGPDQKIGSPGLQSATNEDGEPVLIKYWLRSSGANDSELKEIWTHEIRQLHRLAGYPGANDVIADLVRSGADKRGYYLVLDPGTRRPLQALLDRAPASHWLKQTKVPRHRARLWRNLKRIAQGLELLHAQGLLHRNLDAWSVLTGSEEDQDFQLTGFEWSMRIVSAATKGAAKRSNRVTVYDSFSRDWAMFGGLAAQLCGVDVARLADRSVAPSDVAAHLNPDEVRFLRSLIDIDPFARIDGETITESIDGILSNLAAEIAGREPRLHLVVRLGERSRLSAHLRELSGGQIDVRDFESQLQRINDDLAEGPLLLAIRNPDDSADMRLALRGRDAVYRIRPYTPPQSREQATWDFAECNSCDAKEPTAGQLIGSTQLSAGAVEIMPFSEAAERLGRLRGKLTSWATLRRPFEADSLETAPNELFRLGLVLTQFLEMLQGACDIFPVEVEEVSSSDDSEQRIAVRLRHDPDRDELTKIFGWRSQRDRFEDRLFGRSAVENGLWQLSESAQVGDRSAEATEWRPSDEYDIEEGRIYLFRGNSSPLLQEGYLTPAGSIGRDAVFRRRLKALRALREHTELLSMLTDPRRRVLDSQESLAEDEAFGALDRPKQDALREIVATLPFYLVQGPPGVGKTRLVSELVRRRFADDPTSRLLLTAQSNAAVDHLMQEVTPALGVQSGEMPLIIRCTSRESREAPHPLEIAPQASKLLKALARSTLAATAAPRLRQRIEQLSKADPSGANGRRQGAWSKEADRRAFESIIMRAANLVFATTNSAELEKLVDEKGQCDWASSKRRARRVAGN